MLMSVLRQVRLSLAAYPTKRPDDVRTALPAKREPIARVPAAPLV